MQVWDDRSRPFIVVAAIAPLILPLVASNTRDALFLTVDLVSWAIFVIDFTVRSLYQHRYYRTGTGVFDLSIVLLTFPWYIFPFGATANFMSVFRAARLIRLFTATSLGQRSVKLLGRLGSLGISLLTVSLLAALIVRHAEPVSSGFANLGDALWWSIVSFTTVGYGDLYPVTPLGRFAGVLMMLAGLAALGTVSAVLADSFRGTADEKADAQAEMVAELLAEVKALRAHLESVNDPEAVAEILEDIAESSPAVEPEQFDTLSDDGADGDEEA